MKKLLIASTLGVLFMVSSPPAEAHEPRCPVGMEAHIIGHGPFMIMVCHEPIVRWTPRRYHRHHYQRRDTYRQPRVHRHGRAYHKRRYHRRHRR